jgi:2-keto-3-deoxy-L-rhamnonate aldolase RhmA
MRENRVKRVMQEGSLALVSHTGFADPAIVEIIALAGFDGVFIDMEHTGFDLSLVSEMIRIADLTGITSIVRVPENNPKTILRVLDMGAQGVQVPHVEGIEGAKRAVAAVRYPPVGERGAAGSTRAAGYGSIPWREHVQTSNEEILLIVMTEDLKGINDIEAIAALDGVDLISLGPTDLSAALGITDPSDPRLRQTMEELVNKIHRIGKARVYVPVYHPAFYLTPERTLATWGTLHFGSATAANNRAQRPAGIGLAHPGRNRSVEWCGRRQEVLLHGIVRCHAHDVFGARLYRRSDSGRNAVHDPGKCAIRFERRQSPGLARHHRSRSANPASPGAVGRTGCQAVRRAAPSRGKPLEFD